MALYGIAGVLLARLASNLAAGIYFQEVNLGIRFAGIVATLALVVVPALSCVATREAMNMDDRACCQQMGDKCGAKAESSPKSCCAAEDHAGQPYLASAAKSGMSAPIGIGLVPSLSLAVPTVSNEHFAVIPSRLHSPPRSSSEAIAILRI
jgi:hypothetical protein